MGAEQGKCYLEYTGPIRCSPGIQEVVLPSAYKPFAYRKRVWKKVLSVVLCQTPEIALQSTKLFTEDCSNLQQEFLFAGNIKLPVLDLVSHLSLQQG